LILNKECIPDMTQLPLKPLDGGCHGEDIRLHRDRFRAGRAVRPGGGALAATEAMKEMRRE
jgi:hypothetical protein